MAELHPPKAEEPAKEEKEDVIDIEAKPEITFEDFGKLQFQVGKIIKCEEVKKSKKLRRRCRRKPFPDGTGKGNACRCRNLLIFVLLRTKRMVAKMCENLRILS